MKKEIKIMGAKGGFKVIPNSCKAKHHDQITWKTKLPFFIHFGFVSPLNKRTFSNSEPTGTVRYNAELYGRKKFKYFIAVYRNDKIHFKDPELDIRPEG